MSEESKKSIEEDLIQDDDDSSLDDIIQDALNWVETLNTSSVVQPSKSPKRRKRPSIEMKKRQQPPRPDKRVRTDRKQLRPDRQQLREGRVQPREERVQIRSVQFLQIPQSWDFDNPCEL